MECIVVLTEAEEQTLQQLSINHPYQDMRMRAAALLMLASGQLRAVSAIARWSSPVSASAAADNYRLRCWPLRSRWRRLLRAQRMRSASSKGQINFQI
ncbi:hypothetical protein [Burkholderia paludis]|uniref:hypothetical protein n=1 Tax=Burkholderia paludis TaxID=1506587 RepID=UPI0009DE2261|nr:hypothetical protein [Burkholderia paludis]